MIWTTIGCCLAATGFCFPGSAFGVVAGLSGFAFAIVGYVTTRGERDRRR